MSETHVDETRKRNKGQFKKGNPGGPGNPHARQVARIRATLLTALEPETLYQIVCQLIDKAVRGNLEAIKILLAYAVGRPGKSDDLVELLTEHFPPMDAESDKHRHQTAETADDHRHQTAETADDHRHQTAETVEPHRHQTAETAHAHRHQTAETAHAHRHQTGETAPRAPAPCGPSPISTGIFSPSPRTAVRG